MDELVSLVDNYNKSLASSSFMIIGSATYEQLKSYVLLIQAEKRIKTMKDAVIRGETIGEEDANSLKSLFNPLDSKKRFN